MDAPLVGSSRMMTAAELRARYGDATVYAAQFGPRRSTGAADGEVLLPEGAEELRRRAPDSVAYVREAIGDGPAPTVPELPTPALAVVVAAAAGAFVLRRRSGVHHQTAP